MSDDQIVYSTASYCSLCDQYFPDVHSRESHIQFTSNHPKCDDCNRRFTNKNALRNHFTISRRHHYCSLCRVHFRTAAGFRAHVEYAPVHCDYYNLEDGYGDIDTSYDGWEDDVGLARFPEENYDSSVTPDSDSDSEEDEDDDGDEYDEVVNEYYDDMPPVSSGAIGRAEADTTSQSTSSHPSNSRAGMADMETPRDSISNSAKDITPPGTSDGFSIGCPLCLENASQPCVTRCGHIFCSSCIGHALDAKRSCPVCRVPAGPKQLRRIFFTAPAS